MTAVTFPTAASPSNTSLTLLLGFGAEVVESAIYHAKFFGILFVFPFVAEIQDSVISMKVDIYLSRLY